MLKLNVLEHLVVEVNKYEYPHVRYQRTCSFRGMSQLDYPIVADAAQD
jgi:hypothetical protein